MKQFLKKQRSEIIRTAIQIAFLIFLPSAFSSAFTAVKNVFAAISEGAELTWTPFVTILLCLLGFTVVFGRFFCGYACPFGAVTDWIWKISSFVQKKTKKKLPKIPENVQKYLQGLKYVVLAGILLLCGFGAAGVVNANSPWTLFSLLLSGQHIGAELTIAGILLALIVILSVFEERAFCQFFCPMGAIFSLMPVLPTGQLKRDTDKCLKGCSLCKRTCPVAIQPGEAQLRGGECIRCGKCEFSCPRKNLSVSPVRFRPAEQILVFVRAAILAAVLIFVAGM